MIVVGSKPFGGWRSTRLIGLMIKKHSEKSAFIIKLCRYLLAISRCSNCKFLSIKCLEL